MIHLITGGARSGKSSYAQQLALSLAEDPIYVATARIWDDDFGARVKRHQQDRGPEWTNIEEQLYVSLLPLEGRVAVIDCVTLWLTNFFMQHKQDVDTALYSIQQEINALNTKNATIIIVTNEIGMGVHADTDTGRKFTDLQGWANQYIAQRAQKVVLMVSGIPVTIK
jgi:adenosylcobinamide kinase / adenosylcobinamide-phosphate guanylyltransferase